MAGMVGVAAMDAYFRALKGIKAKRRSARPDIDGKSTRQHAPAADEAGPLDDISLVGQQGRPDEPSTEVVGRKLHESVLHEEPSAPVRRRMGTAVHWGYGMAVGGLYGALSPRAGDAEVAMGAGYGAALWLLGDELAVPLLGLSKGPTGVPGRVHAEALGAHLVYGMTTSAAVRALRRFV
jgi:hypothetical protein